MYELDCSLQRIGVWASAGWRLELNNEARWSPVNEHISAVPELAFCLVYRCKPLPNEFHDT